MSYAPRRLCSLTVVMLFVLVSLTACSPRPDPTLALRRGADGHIEALVFVCGSDDVSMLNLYDRDSGAAWAVERPDNTPLRPDVSTVLVYTLFQTPPGWSRPEDALTALDPQRRYGAWASIVNRSGPRLLFSLNDLDIPEGKVLTGQDAKLKVVTRSEFERQAGDTCPSRSRPRP